MERRAFLRLSCVACVAVAGAGIVLPSLSGCSTIPIMKSSAVNKIITVPVTVFKDGQLAIIRDIKLTSDILLVKKSATEVTAIEMKCSHQEQPLTATKTGLSCSAHGSTFDLDGNVTHDPATKPLKKFPAVVSAETIVITIS